MTGDPITNELHLQFPGAYGAGNQSSPDVIKPIAPAEKILYYSESGSPAAALRYEDPVKKYRLVYLSFGFEGIGGPNVDSAQKLMNNILTWLPQPSAVHQLSDSRLPEDFILEQNYPNPFNPTTTISYALAKDSQVRLTVYNTLGQVVAVLLDGYQAKGSYCVKWETHHQPSGIYLYQLKAIDFSAARKMFLQK